MKWLVRGVTLVVMGVLVWAVGQYLGQVGPWETLVARVRGRVR